MNFAHSLALNMRVFLRIRVLCYIKGVSGKVSYPMPGIIPRSGILMWFVASAVYAHHTGSWVKIQCWELSLYYIFPPVRRIK